MKEIALNLIGKVWDRLKGEASNEDLEFIQLFHKYINQREKEGIGENTLSGVLAQECTFLKEWSPSNQFEDNIKKDLRLENLRLKGFRKYPNSPNGYYYIPFSIQKSNNTQEATPCSCFYLGSNGSGKTTIFSALEELFTNRVSAAEMRKIEQSRFILHARTPSDELEIKVKTHDEEVSYKMGEYSMISRYGTLLCPFFSSEYDIYKFVESTNLSEYIYGQMGYEYAFLLIKALSEERLEEERAKTKIIEEKKQKREQVECTISCRVTLFDFFLKLAQELNNDKSSEKADSFLELIISMSKFSNTLPQFDSTEELSRSGIEDRHRELCRLKKFADDENLKILDFIKSFFIDSELINFEFIKNEYVNFINGIEKVLYCIANILKRKESLNIPKQLIQEYINSYEDFSHIFHSFILKRQAIYELLYELFEWQDKSVLKYLEIYFLKLTEARKEVNEINEKINAQQSNHNFKKYEKSIEKFREEYSKVFNIQTRWAFRNIKKICGKLLEEFFFDNESIRINIPEYNQLNLGSMSNEIRIEFLFDKKIPLDPKLYLNSFRFKLYCLVLKIGIAFSIKQLWNINFPLIFDDVFYSSDFKSREKVENFIRVLFEFHDKLFTQEEKNTDDAISNNANDVDFVPLQLIFFTHDEVIAQAAVKGLSKRISKSNTDYISGRIFDYRSMESGKKIEESTEEANNMNQEQNITLVKIYQCKK